MSDGSKIEWTHQGGTRGETWNPTTGCDRISPGCDHCYALEMARRLKAMGQAKYQNDGDPRTSGPGFGVTVHPDTLDTPLGWRKPRTVFVNSMSDLFHARVPKTFAGGVWNTMALTPWHTYQILTKRPERMCRILTAWADAGWMWRKQDMIWCGPIPGPLPNAWLGTSIESNEYAYRAGELRATPAAIRFLSLEPLLGPLPDLDLAGIDWAIIGGESGRGSRPLDLGWVRDIIARCRESGTAVFVKQLGSPWARENGTSDKGGDWSLWPEDLRIREFPATTEAVPASAALFAEIGGRHVSLSLCDWVLWGPCGCPWGVSVARCSPTEDMAWRSFYDTKREVERARKRGGRLELVTHQRWCDEIADRMKVRCEHGEAAS